MDKYLLVACTYGSYCPRMTRYNHKKTFPLIIRGGTQYGLKYVSFRLENPHEVTLNSLALALFFDDAIHLGDSPLGQHNYHPPRMLVLGWRDMVALELSSKHMGS